MANPPAARTGAPRVSSPEFMLSGAAGEIVARLIELGTEAHEAKAAESGTATFTAAITRTGRRAIAELLAVHGLDGSGR